MSDTLHLPPTALDRLAERLATFFVIVGGVLLVAASALTVLSVIGSLALSPVPGEIEVVEILCGLAVFAFLPFCQLKRGHVGVDILISAFGKTAMNVSQLVGDLVITVLLSIVTWRLWVGLVDKFGNGETTALLIIPVWWGYAGAFVLLLVNILVCLAVLVSDYRHMRQGSSIVSSGSH